MWRIRFLTGVAIALLPCFIKLPLYRLFYGYQIGRGVRIGLSPFVGVGQCRIGDNVRIGSFNLFYRVEKLEIGDHTRIGFFNIFRGGRRVSLGRYVTVLRLNTFNAIIDGDFLVPVETVLDLGAGVFVATGHWLDFSERITIGAHTILGGRNSSLWTHNRQRSKAIEIGAHCYLGSEVRVAPGVDVPAFCIVALGSVLTGRLEPSRSLIGGNPAQVQRPLRDEDLYLVCRKTRNDIPDEVNDADLPKDLFINGAEVTGAKLAPMRAS